MNVKNGPVHYYCTPDRDSFPTYVVEHVVQIGERQYLSRSQARAMIGDGLVTLNGKKIDSLKRPIQPGALTLKIRGVTHHVVIHGTIRE